MSRRPLLIAVPAALLLAAPLVSAVPQQPETRILTVTTFKVPFGDFEKFFETVDKYAIPQVKADPNVLTYRIATHAWGETDKTVWIIAEYKSLSAIDESNQWGNEWFDKNYPEGTAKRDSADKAFEQNFLPYFQNHSDNILTMNVTRTK